MRAIILGTALFLGILGFLIFMGGYDIYSNPLRGASFWESFFSTSPAEYLHKKAHLNLLWLHTDGQYIKDSYGRSIKIRGVVFRPSTAGESWMTTDMNIVRQDLDQLYSFGVRFIRIESDWNMWYYNNREKINWLHQVLDYMKAKGMRAFLSVHGDFDLDVLVNPDSYTYLWAFIAEEYRDKNSLVGIGYWNEPSIWYWQNSGGYTEQQFYDMYYNLYYKIAARLRTINPNLLILVGGDGNAVVPFHNPLPFSNIVYVFNQHYRYYRWTPDYSWYDLFVEGRFEEGKQAFKGYLENMGALRLNNVPLINMEWGFFIDDPNWQHVARAMFEVMEENNIGWMGWLWTIGADDSLILSRYQLSQWGNVWYDLLN